VVTLNKASIPSANETKIEFEYLPLYGTNFSPDVTQYDSSLSISSNEKIYEQIVEL